ncbi:MAG: GNAT family N-acetyltransferase [Microbacteriaceae bacterium]|nr:GNAT family N-acetyltransferase [Microbacteriaceae bacterium]
MAGHIENRVAAPSEHAALARAVGWQSHFDEQVIAASLRASLAGVVFVHSEHGTIGMARAVGDGLQYAYVQDVIVHPDHGGGGIGTMLVERLLELLIPQPGVELFVGLFASDEARGVYESIGFTTDHATGMHLRLRGDAPSPSPRD